MKRALILAIIGLAPLAARPLPRPYSVEHYDVRLGPDLSAQRISGDATLTVRGAAERLVALELDAGGLEITSVDEGQTKLFFERHDKLLLIELPTPLYKGDRRNIRIRYTAGPAKGLVFYPDQVYTSFFTNDWLPSNDRPEDRATLRLTIDASAKFKVAASGRHEGSSWIVDAPAPPFLFAFAIGDYQEPSPQVASATEAAMRFFTEKTGKSLPGPYTQVFLHGNVEQESVGLTLLPDSYAANLKQHPDDLWLVAHELAHQWFAIGIPCRDWSDFWLNEGMATFMADAFLESRFGKARYEKEIADARGIYEQLARDGKDRALSFSDWETTQQASGRLPYNKGAWVLAQLRTQMGDARFWAGLRLYTEQHWGKPVVSEDFQKSMEESSHMKLDKFFQKWVY